MAQEISTADVKTLVYRLQEEKFWPTSLVREIAVKGQHGAEQWTLSRPLTSAERNRLHIEAGQIDEVLTQAHPDEIKKAVAWMLLTWPVSAKTTDKEMLQRVSVYAAALARFPAWAINEACGMYVKGEIERDHAFAPAAPEVAVQVSAIVRPFRERREVHRRMLEAKAMEPASKANADKVASLMRSAFGG